MEITRFKYSLPPCRVNRGLIVQLENYLRMQIPSLYKRELAGMMSVLDLKSSASLKTYSLAVQDRSGSRELESIAALPDRPFSPSLRRITLKLKIGRPELLSMTLLFAVGEEATLEISTLSRQVLQDCPRIAAGVSAVVRTWGTRHGIFHSRFFQVLLALSIPAVVVGYGWLRSIDFFFLLSAQGWLLLLGGALSLTLPRLFPLVSFQTRRRIDFRRLGFLGLLALNLAAISSYVRLLVFELERMRM